MFCDPWETEMLFDNLYKYVSETSCPHCLPDCTADIYHQRLVTVPFRPCDEANLGVSSLCNLENQVKFTLEGHLKRSSVKSPNNRSPEGWSNTTWVGRSWAPILAPA